MLHFLMFDDNDYNQKISNKLPIRLKKISTLSVDETLEVDPSYSAKAQAVR